jgi:hypothetical protein
MLECEVKRPKNLADDQSRVTNLVEDENGFNHWSVFVQYSMSSFRYSPQSSQSVYIYIYDLIVASKSYPLSFAHRYAVQKKKSQNAVPCHA